MCVKGYQFGQGILRFFTSMFTNSNQQVFDSIYKNNSWIFGSGIGSIATFNKPFINFINEYLRDHTDIHTVVDIGCGDWQIGRHFELGERKYIGCDVSEFILKKVESRFASPHIRFQQLDAVSDMLPKGDLIIVKDVLQHLSLADAARILQKLEGYKHVIIQNDVYQAQVANKEILNGGFRPLDIRLAPFRLNQYKEAHKYTEGLRIPLNASRRLFFMTPIRKSILINN